MEYLRAWESTPQTRKAFTKLAHTRLYPYFNKFPAMGSGLSEVKDFVIPNLPPPEQMDAMVAGTINKFAQKSRLKRKSKRKRRKSRKSRRRTVY